MKSTPLSEFEFEPLIKLIEVMWSDPVINEKISSILKLKSFQRRRVVNYWLEQLYSYNANEDLQQALTFLLYDEVAANVLELISHHKAEEECI